MLMLGEAVDFVSKKGSVLGVDVLLIRDLIC